jgi:hypothetical protein
MKTQRKRLFPQNKNFKPYKHCITNVKPRGKWQKNMVMVMILLAIERGKEAKFKSSVLSKASNGGLRHIDR